MTGIPIAGGARYLYDQHVNYWRPGLPVFLRVRNFVAPQTGFVELGFSFAPSGVQSLDQGFTDICVKPQPEVKDISLHNIGLNQARLNFGARLFAISHTFVLKRMQEMKYTDPYQVWRDPSVIGLFYNKRLFSIEIPLHEEYGGQTLVWNLTCNAQEQPVTVSGS